MKSKNTYSLLAASEEKGRSIFEGALYAIVILCVAFSGWQFAANAVVIPGTSAVKKDSTAPVEMIANVPAEQPVVAAAGGADASAL